jgi:hypothetical protein
VILILCRSLLLQIGADCYVTNEGRILSELCTLASLGIDRDSTLHVCGRLLGGMADKGKMKKMKTKAAKAKVAKAKAAKRLANIKLFTTVNNMQQATEDQLRRCVAAVIEELECLKFINLSTASKLRRCSKHDCAAVFNQMRIKCSVDPATGTFAAIDNGCWNSLLFQCSKCQCHMAYQSERRLLRVQKPSLD